MGMWIGRDLLQEAAGPNLYQYALNAPSTHADMLGLVDILVVRGWLRFADPTWEASSRSWIDNVADPVKEALEKFGGRDFRGEPCSMTVLNGGADTVDRLKLKSAPWKDALVGIIWLKWSHLGHPLIYHQADDVELHMYDFAPIKPTLKLYYAGSHSKAIAQQLDPYGNYIVGETIGDSTTVASGLFLRAKLIEAINTIRCCRCRGTEDGLVRERFGWTQQGMQSITTLEPGEKCEWETNINN